MTVTPQQAAFIAKWLLPLVIEVLEEKCPDDDRAKLAVTIVKGILSQVGLSN